MWDILNQLRSIRQNIYNQVGSEIQNVLGNINTGVSNYVIKPISTDVSNVLGEIGNSVRYLENTASNGIRSTLSSVGRAMRSAEQNTVAGFTGGMNAIESVIAKLSQDIYAGLNKVVNGVENGYTAMHNGVVSVFHIISTSVEQGIKYLADKLVTGIKEIIVPFTHFVEALPKDIESFVEAVGTNIKDLAVTIKDFESKWADSTARLEISAAKEIEKVVSAHTDLGSIKALAKPNFSMISKLIGIDIDKLDKHMFERLAAGITLEMFISSSAMLDEGLAYMLGQQLPSLLNVAMKSSWRNLEQAANAEIPNMLLGVGEAIGARYKGYISDKYFYDQIERAGLSKENADIMYKTADTLLGLGELVSLFFRGYIKSKDELYK